MKQLEPLLSNEIVNFNILSKDELENKKFRYNKAKWLEFSYGIQNVLVVGPNTGDKNFQIEDECGVNVYILKLHNRNKIKLNNSHAAALVMLSGQINITLHLDEGDLTIWVKEGDTLCIPEGISYDLNLITSEANYYLYISDNHTCVELL